MTEFEIAFEIAAEIARCHAITGHGPGRCPICDAWSCSCAKEDAPQPLVPNRIAELERHVSDLKARYQGLCCLVLTRESELEAMTAQRDTALLRMEAAIATSHGLINAEVQRRIAAVGDHAPRAFPASALRHQRQSGGLLSTADAGRVRLGGYAPALPPA